MGKYVIHFDDKPWQDLNDELYYRCFEIPWFSTTKTTISRLTPYTEDSAYAHGYTEAESKYREIRDELEKQAFEKGYGTAVAEQECAVRKAAEKAYQKGLSDAWDAAREIGSNSMCSLKEMGFDFSRCVVADYNPSWFVVKNYSASEAIEKIRQYEQKKEEQIQVGDEVALKSGSKGFVTRILMPGDGHKSAYVVWSDGYVGNYGFDVLQKTGRHYSDVVEVLHKMGENDG